MEKMTHFLTLGPGRSHATPLRAANAPAPKCPGCPRCKPERFAASQKPAPDSLGWDPVRLEAVARNGGPADAREAELRLRVLRERRIESWAAKSILERAQSFKRTPILGGAPGESIFDRK